MSEIVFEIIDKVPLERGSKVSVKENQSMQINNDNILVIQTQNKSFDATTEEINITEKVSEDDEEFIQKYKIRKGKYYFDEDKGLLKIPDHKELFFETKTSKYIKKLFYNFIEKSSRIKDKYNKTKRSYLLHSSPGVGKSALIRNFCESVSTDTGTAIIQTDGEINFHKLTRSFLLDYEDGVTSIVLIIEDFGKRDYILNKNIINSTCLNFLDGISGLFRVPTLIITTTNFAEYLGPQLTNRPGRFNKIIKVLPPSIDEIFELVKIVSGTELNDSEKIVFEGYENDLTPDHVLECLVRKEIENVSLEQAIEEIFLEREGMSEWNT